MSLTTICDHRDAALEYARLRFRARPDWLTYLNDVKSYCDRLMGVEEATLFFRQRECREVHGMVVQLAMNSTAPRSHRMITVRLPIELHQALKGEAEKRETSLNRLCIAKLLRSISDSATVTVGSDLPVERGDISQGI